MKTLTNEEKAIQNAIQLRAMENGDSVGYDSMFGECIKYDNVELADFDQLFDYKEDGTELFYEFVRNWTKKNV